MSKKNNAEEKFGKHLLRAIGGALILIVLLIIWLIWDRIYHWFYQIFSNAPQGTLLMVWLMLLFPIMFSGLSLLFSGGYKVYKIAAPEAEE